MEVTNLWLPGVGLVPAHVRSAQKAVEEYDADLHLGRDEDTGDWVVLFKRGPEGRPFPVLGLGTELPAPEAIKRKLYMADTRRRGREIVASIVKRREAAEAESRRLAHDAGGEVAEAMDVALHKMKRHPVPRIFIPGKD